ncbi:MAG: flavin containing amine oxidoreductase-like protein [Proteobacteria bacterium]|nr:MAG: flavin containing amine oxidoreductase-like protein [Pseudomonadota bacterium]
MKQRIAIIGAGLSGLHLANRLAAGAEIVVFEKARGVGGRMATRRFENFSFDHGANFFTARSPEFKSFLKPSVASGLAQEWKGKVITLAKGKKPGKRFWYEPHYVGCPGMNFLCKQLAEGITVRTSCEVGPLAEKVDGQWPLFNIQGGALGSFDLVISTAPPAQTLRLFGPHLPANAGMRGEKFVACYALLVGLPTPWKQSWMAAKVQDSPFEWISVDSRKPGRDQSLTALVAHTGSHWAEAHVDSDQEEIQRILGQELESLIPLKLESAAYLSLHRWRYATLEKAHDEFDAEAPFYDPTLQLACAGDWCTRSNVEHAWLSADRLASQIIASELG